MNENITDGTNYKLQILDLGINATGKLHFSILAKESAQFIFFKENLGSGFILSIDGWGDYHRSNIRFCSEIPVYSGAINCVFLAVRLFLKKFGFIFVLLLIAGMEFYTN
jgi:hypothetical protein